VVSADIYNAAGGPTVLVAAIETGTCYRATAYATETDYGVVLADRVVWMPVDMLGEHFGRLTNAQRDRHRPPDPTLPYRSRAACTALVRRAKVSSSSWPTRSPVQAR